MTTTMPDAATRWLMAMSEAGYPQEAVRLDEDGGVLVPALSSASEGLLRAAWKAHQLARTGRAEQFDSYEDYRAWWVSENPGVVIQDG